MVNGVPKIFKDVQVTIPVKTIKSTEGRMMDNKTYEAFQSDTHPTITFAVPLSQVTVDESRNIVIKASGKLTMAGTTRPVVIEARGKVLPNGDLQIAVAQHINMIDFNMKPPTVMMGAIKVGDAVTVVVDLVLNSAQHVLE
jgi:polyisoprenoid-binding protein YceI